MMITPGIGIVTPPLCLADYHAQHAVLIFAAVVCCLACVYWWCCLVSADSYHCLKLVFCFCSLGLVALAATLKCQESY